MVTKTKQTLIEHLFNFDGIRGDPFAAAHRTHAIEQMKGGRSVVRGKHSSRQTLHAVKKHIHSFPAETSHYLRKHHEDRRYLSSDLNIRKLYQLYMRSEDGRRLPLGETKFEELFHKEDVHFGFPLCDTCTKCDQERVHKLGCQMPNCAECKTFSEHQTRVKSAADARREDEQRARENADHVALAIDLMKSLQVPKLPNEKMYYLRKLSTYVFGVHNYRDKSATMYWWSEDVGGRGSDEIGSCLWHYLNALTSNVKSISIWADRCSGQKCQLVHHHFALLRNVVVEFHLFETGHSFQACDGDFSLIERGLPTVMQLPREIQNTCSAEGAIAVQNTRDDDHNVARSESNCEASRETSADRH